MLGTILFYNTILLFSTLFIYLSEKEKTILGRYICTIIAFLIVFLPAAFRYEIGADYLNYRDIYIDIGLGHNSYVEPGYYYLNKILSYFNLEPEWLFGIIAFIIYLFAFLSYPVQYRTLFHYFYMTVFYFSTFNLLRSMVVTSLILFAIMRYRENKNIILFLSLIGFASLFHKTAILIAFLPLFYNRIGVELFKRNSFLLISLFIGTYILKDYIILWITNSSLIEIIGYKNYFSNPLWNQPAELGTGLGVIVKITTLLSVIIFTRRIISQENKNTPLILVVYACLFALSFSLSIGIFSRIEKLYSIAYIFAPLMLISTPNIPFKQGIIVISVLFWFYSFNMSILNGTTDHYKSCKSGKISPYVSIFNKKDNRRHPDIKHKGDCERILGIPIRN